MKLNFPLNKTKNHTKSVIITIYYTIILNNLHLLFTQEIVRTKMGHHITNSAQSSLPP